MSAVKLYRIKPLTRLVSTSRSIIHFYYFLKSFVCHKNLFTTMHCRKRAIYDQFFGLRRQHGLTLDFIVLIHSYQYYARPGYRVKEASFECAQAHACLA